MSEDEKGRSLSAINIECIATATAAAAFVIFNAYTYITSVYTME